MSYKPAWGTGGGGPCDWPNITNKPSVFPPDVTNLATQAELDAGLGGKADTTHNHDSNYAPIAHVSAANPHSGHEVTSMKGQANGYASLDATGKVPSAQLPASGSDPWTYLKITAADFTTSSATAVDITGLGWTPLANTWYEFHGMLLLRTATATVNPRAGLAWATGLTDGIARIEEAQAAGTAPLNASGNIGASLLIAVGGLPNTTQSWPATLWGTFRSGASPSGTVRAQLASETAGTVVRATIGSFLRYRVIP
jgi:hypothetical protein